MGTAALVNNFCPAHFDGKRFVIGGIFGELRDRLIQRRSIYSYEENWKNGMNLELYDPNAFHEEAIALCRQAGVQLLLGQSIHDISADEDRVTQIHSGKSGELKGKVIVDASGDALVAARSGVPFRFGRAGDQAVMPLTFCYMIGPIDLEHARRETSRFVLRDNNVGEDFYFLSGWYPEVDCKIQAARASGELQIPRDHISMIAGVPGKPGYATVNYGRVNIQDPTDPEQLAAAEVIGKEQVADGIRFFRKHLPGFAKVKLVELARQIGVRESRQIVGQYLLTGEDALSGRQFDDVIAQCSYPVDIHEPGSDQTTIKPIGGCGHYDIPWRCLIPQTGPRNLIVAGRSISATQEAMSSFRVSPSVMAIGEAAGVTAALAARQECAVAAVSIQEVQQRLLENGGILETPFSLSGHSKNLDIL